MLVLWVVYCTWNFTTYCTAKNSKVNLYSWLVLLLPFSWQEKEHLRCYLQSQHYQKLQSSHPLEFSYKKVMKLQEIYFLFFSPSYLHISNKAFILWTQLSKLVWNDFYIQYQIENETLELRNKNALQLPDWERLKSIHYQSQMILNTLPISSALNPVQVKVSRFLITRFCIWTHINSKTNTLCEQYHTREL